MTGIVLIPETEIEDPALEEEEPVPLGLTVPELVEVEVLFFVLPLEPVLLFLVCEPKMLKISPIP